jgi:hypothetical protein
MRHERLHTRAGSAADTSSSPNTVSGAVMPESFQTLRVGSNGGIALACASMQNQTPPKRQPALAGGLQQVTPPAAELDFELIWPDSEDLFQTIMSSDAVNQWQIPLGTLPFPADDHLASNNSFGSPCSFDDRVPSIGAIPSGGNHQAVHNVSKMITSLVSLLIGTRHGLLTI